MTDIQILITVVAVISFFIVGAPLILVVLLPIFKPTISEKANRYLYAFSSGFFLITATVLLIGESKTHLEEGLGNVINNEVGTKAVLAVVLSMTVLLMLLLSLAGKFFFAKKRGINVHSHNHDDEIIVNEHKDKRSKAFAFFFLFSHKIPDGLIIGLLCAQIAKSPEISIANIVFLCSFVIHVLPEELITYYRQIDMGISKKRAALNSFLADVIVVPLVIIGSIIGWYSLENDIAIYMVQLVAASFLLFLSIVEFIPEFVHDVKIGNKSWYLTVIIFFIGIAAALFVICFHDHSHSHDHNHEHVELAFNQIKNMLIL